MKWRNLAKYAGLAILFVASGITAPRIGQKVMFMIIATYYFLRGVWEVSER